MDIPFVVESYSWKSKAGKAPVFKASLKSPGGHNRFPNRAEAIRLAIRELVTQERYFVFHERERGPRT